MSGTQQTALAALRCAEPSIKLAAVAALDQAVQASGLVGQWVVVDRIDVPGRPDRPQLVMPTKVPRRRLGSIQGRAALIHAVAHIEFNAINLALDAMVRFPELPEQYYLDWLSVAVDEARHFSLLCDRLAELGFAYGDFDAHNGLWEMAVKTDHDPLIRMALVPRVLEARGLDVTPAMIDRLIAVGDDPTVAVLRVILTEEIGHVAIGTHWFKYLCQLRGSDPDQTFSRLMREHYDGRVKGPFNYPARQTAGFSDSEMATLERLGRS